ncbi:Zinc finger protein BRUTUS-like At1g18910 [Linum perenne]
MAGRKDVDDQEQNEVDQGENHRAIRRELADLFRIDVIAASESEGGETVGAIDEIRCRFELLQLADGYCSGVVGDEVIFPALDDVHVKKVCANSLEHKILDDEQDEVSRCLKLLVEEKQEGSSEPFQEIASRLSIIHSSNCHQMLKEEKQVLIPQTARLMKPVPKIPVKESSSAATMDEPIPLDFMLFFNKALKKDLENLVFYSAELAEKSGFLKEFCQRFNLLRHQYKLHRDAEDEWIFPLLEAGRKSENISHFYTIDHKLEYKDFQKISIILEEMSGLQMPVPIGTHKQAWRIVRYSYLYQKLHCRCKYIQNLLYDHIHHQENVLWPVIKQCMTIEEQEKVVASILGRTGAKTLQVMIPWLAASLKPEEHIAVMSLYHKVTKHTNFSDWLGEWWEVCDKATISEDLSSSCDTNSLEIISRYLSSESSHDKKDDIFSNRSINFPQENCNGANTVVYSDSKDDAKIAVVDEEENCNGANTVVYSDSKDAKKISAVDEEENECLDCIKALTLGDEKTCNDVADITDEKANADQPFQETLNSMNHGHLSSIAQVDLEVAIRRICQDSSLEPEKKSRIIQHLLTSRWLIQKQIYHTDEFPATNQKVLQGQHPSYQDPIKLTLGCKHYKRNCKLLAECCNQLYTCVRCHDESADHSADREIYHCPFCNICRVGKGLGIDYFHCMKCNACMSEAVTSTHICREKCFEDNCPICYDSIFTSSTPVKALPCGHLMHTSCFQDYTSNHYICPLCSKSIGDMKVYFKMLDSLLAEERRTPDEYADQTQDILCNDCEKKGSARFHQLYHKCSDCGSYNTRLL